MAKFYFTYGTEGQPFYGGWSEIEAPTIGIACKVFTAYHPCRGGSDLLNCCSVYTEERFKRTSMAGPGGNFGYRCHERITCIIRREVFG